LYGALIAPLVEELLFRSGLLLPMARQLGRAGAIVGTALLFGMMHMSDPQAVPPLIVLGLLLGWVRLGSGSLGPPLALHIGNNLIALLLLFLD